MNITLNLVNTPTFMICGKWKIFLNSSFGTLLGLFSGLVLLLFCEFVQNFEYFNKLSGLNFDRTVVLNVEIIIETLKLLFLFFQLFLTFVCLHLISWLAFNWQNLGQISFFEIIFLLIFFFSYIYLSRIVAIKNY